MGRCGCVGTCSCDIRAGQGISVTGSGTPADPVMVALDCNGAADCIGSRIGQGLAYDPALHVLSGKRSSQAGNALTFGADGGFYISPAQAGIISTANSGTVTLTGNGQAATPLVAQLSAGTAQRLADRVDACAVFTTTPITALGQNFPVSLSGWQGQPGIITILAGNVITVVQAGAYWLDIQAWVGNMAGAGVLSVSPWLGGTQALVMTQTRGTADGLDVTVAATSRLWNLDAGDTVYVNASCLVALAPGGATLFSGHLGFHRVGPQLAGLPTAANPQGTLRTAQ